MHDDAHKPTLREMLRAAGISDREVERRGGPTALALRNIEMGVTRRPSWLTCSRLAALLGVDVLDVAAAARESIRRATARKADAS